MYDSLNSGNITAKVADKVANTAENQKINEPIKSVQQHRNYVTCGVYPIETSFGFGNWHEEIIYDSKIMAST